MLAYYRIAARESSAHPMPLLAASEALAGETYP
jgi:hypothetical protein